MKPHSKFGIFFRGVLMGIAEILPGISGGTIALITGIYSSLISALASFSVRSISLLRFPRAFFEKHDLGSVSYTHLTLPTNREV